MTPTRDEIEQARQHAAELPPATDASATEAAGVRQYRQLYLALREIELPQAPDGFAQRIERLVRAPTQPRADETAELWGVCLGVIALLGLLIAASFARALPLLRHWQGQASHAPWQVLLTSVAILVAMAVFDHRQRFVDGG